MMADDALSARTDLWLEKLPPKPHRHRKDSTSQGKDVGERGASLQCGRVEKYAAHQTSDSPGGAEPEAAQMGRTRRHEKKVGLERGSSISVPGW